MATVLDATIDTNDIKSQNLTFFEQSLQLLKIWNKRSYPNTKINTLIHALKRINRNDIIEAITSYCESEGFDEFESSASSMELTLNFRNYS